MAEVVEKENVEFRRHVAEYKTKSQPTSGLTSSPTSSPRTRTPNGAEPERP
jgi:hypothetical protein